MCPKRVPENNVSVGALATSYETKAGWEAQKGRSIAAKPGSVGRLEPSLVIAAACALLDEVALRDGDSLPGDVAHVIAQRAFGLRESGGVEWGHRGACRGRGKGDGAGNVAGVPGGPRP